MRLYLSISANSSLNLSTLSGLKVPALSNFLCCFTQFNILCSSMRCFDGFRWLVLINSTTSSYLSSQRSSCVIRTFLYNPESLATLLLSQLISAFLICKLYTCFLKHHEGLQTYEQQVVQRIDMLRHFYLIRNFPLGF